MDVVITMLPNGEILRSVYALVVPAGKPGALYIDCSTVDVDSSRAVHCGHAGAGQAAKICNNMLLGISMIGACEAFALADKLDLDQQKLFDVISTSSGSCWSINTYCPTPGVGPQSPADNDYQPGFAVELMLKDLSLGQQAAESADAATPLGELATKLYKEFAEADGTGKGFSAMLPRLSAMKRGPNR